MFELKGLARKARREYFLVRGVVRRLAKEDKTLNFLLLFFSLFCSTTALRFLEPITASIISFLLAFFLSSSPILGVIVVSFFTVIAAFYHSSPLAFFILFLVSLVLFTVFRDWKCVAFVIILTFLPLLPYPVSLISGFWYLIVVLAVFHLGSRRAFALVLPSMLLSALFSATWGVKNYSFFAIRENLIGYDQPDIAKPTKQPLSLLTLYQFSLASFSDFFAGFNTVLHAMFFNIVKLLISDMFYVQIFTVAIVMFLIAFFSGILKGKFTQFKASLPILFIPAVFYFVYSQLSLPYPLEFPLYIFATLLSIYIADKKGIYLSREREVRHSVLMGDATPLPHITFDDIAGYDDVKQELRTAVITPLEKIDIAEAYGLKVPKGILLFGPPGTGKTMLMWALANETNFNFQYVKIPDLLSKYYGETEKNIHRVFERARKYAPTILFFDEIDAIAKSRDMVRDANVSAIEVFLQELDGLKRDDRVIVVAATNVPHLLDKALLRPGRFDKIIYMRLPTLEERKKIIELYLNKLRKTNPEIVGDVDIDLIARKTERFSGADIANLFNEVKRVVAQRALRKGKLVPITTKDFLQLLKYMKPSVSLSMLEKYERFKLDFERRAGIIKEKEEKKEGVITFEDVAGMEEVKQALRDAIELPLLHEDLLKKYKIKPAKGILMFGPPGCGKTYIIKAAANEFKVSLYLISGSELFKKGYEDALKTLKETFYSARDNRPAIIFIDEIETIVPARGKGLGLLTGELLTLMDGFRELRGVVVVGATNRPFDIDPALLRPGRFDKIIYVPPPDFEARKRLFEMYLGEFAKNVDIERLAGITEGYSSADIASICQAVKLKLAKMELSGKKPVITTEMVIKEIKRRKPSITKDMLMMYKEFIKYFGERK